MLNGITLFDEYLSEDGILHRKDAMNFMNEDIYNLENFGDYIAIDPTFYTISSNWSIIPITVIGPERDVKCASVIFSCNTNEDRFLWILKLLLYGLSSKGKITTICTDDDSGFNASFRDDFTNDDFRLKKAI